MIKRFSLTYRMDPNLYNKSGQSKPGSNSNKEVFSIISKD